MVQKVTKSRLVQMLLILTMVFALFGCGQAAQEPNDSELQPKTETGVKNEKKADFPVTITDGTGTEVTIKAKPKRIITLVPNVTETIFALGLDEEVFAVNDYSNYPEAATKKEKLATYPTVDAEKVTALEPDLIVADMINGQETIDALRKLGFPVIVSNAISFDSVYESIDIFAKATGTVEKGNEIIEQMKKEREQVEKAVADIPVSERVKVWVEVSPEGLYTWGKGTFFNDMITAAGGLNIAADYESWDPYSAEKVVEANPDVILATYGNDKPNEAIHTIKSRPGWDNIEAVKNNRMYTLDSDKTNRPAPRITQGLMDMAKALYPDRF